MEKRQKAFQFLFVVFLVLLTSHESKLIANTINQSVKNFGKKTYQASNQNWSVDAGPNGFMYFANHKGLLEFDGINWKLYKLPNETIIRSVLVATDSLIYTSGYRELGFWKPDVNGQLTYHSLNSLAEKYFTQNEEFWNISTLGSTVYFHSFTRIFAYKNDSIVPFSVPGFTNTMNRVGNKMLIAVKNRGIFSIEGGTSVPIATGSFFMDKVVSFLLPYKKNQLLIGTMSSGIFIWDGKQIYEWNRKWSDYFKKNEVNRAYWNNQQQLIVGTILDGISIFDEEGEFIAKYNTFNGLQNNTILGIVVDKFDNIWLSLDSGIDFISNDSNYGFQIETIPGIGAVYDAAIFENKIYFGTNQGLFSRDLYNNNGDYLLVPGTQGQIWDCHVFDNHLFAGHNEGIFMIKNGVSQLISQQAGGFSIRQDPLQNNYLIESTYTSMPKLKKVKGTYVQDGLIKGFFDLIRYIEIDHLGNIWASHMHRGIYKLQLNDSRDSVINKIYYGEQSVFKKDHSVHVFKVENRIVFTSEELLYTYDDLNDSIIPYLFLNDKLGDFARSHRIIEAPDHHYWFVCKEKIGLFVIYNNTVSLIKSYPRSLFSDNQLIDDFENILPLTITKAIVCLENGIAQLDAAISDSISEIRNFTPHLRELKLTSRNGDINLLPANKNTAFVKFNYHNIRVRYSFPLYTHNPIYFQSFMKGLDQNWSEKSNDPQFVFDRLPAGEYELLVKAVDQWGIESQVDRLLITVAPPWYLTNYARVGYSVMFLAIIFGFRDWGIKQTRKKERLQLEKREKELIRLRNEKLRTEVKHKSKELANSTMAIIKKNEFLLEIKKIVADQKEQLGTRYPDKYFNHIISKIDKNITSHDDWQLFETNFERAHEQFLTKIKEINPQLTPGDLRLCAYLRMNLYSKEIAPLLGISVRGVENHRYKLRKKLHLSPEENITDYILKL